MIALAWGRGLSHPPLLDSSLCLRKRNIPPGFCWAKVIESSCPTREEFLCGLRESNSFVLNGLVFLGGSAKQQGNSFQAIRSTSTDPQKFAAPMAEWVHVASRARHCERQVIDSFAHGFVIFTEAFFVHLREAVDVLDA